MVLREARVGHTIGGRTYLAPKDVTEAEHKQRCRNAYGNLHDVRIQTLPAGTQLKVAGAHGEYWQIV